MGYENAVKGSAAGHPIFFCREVISFAVRFFFLP